SREEHAPAGPIEAVDDPNALGIAIGDEDANCVRLRHHGLHLYRDAAPCHRSTRPAATTFLTRKLDAGGVSKSEVPMPIAKRNAWRRPVATPRARYDPCAMERLDHRVP